MNTYKIAGNGINSVVAWNQERFELVSLRQAIDMEELLFGLAESKFFTSEEVKEVIGYERANKYNISKRTGMSGCKDYSLYEFREMHICGENFTDSILRSRVHISCAQKFNKGINCSLLDFVTISFKEWGWGSYYQNPEWIETNIEAYLKESAYTRVSRRFSLDSDSPSWLESMKRIDPWWQSVNVFKIESYKGEYEKGSLASATLAPLPKFLYSQEVELRENREKFFSTNEWVKIFNDDPSDTSGYIIPLCKYRKIEHGGEYGIYDLDELLYCLNEYEEPTGRTLEQLKNELYDKVQIGQIPFEQNDGKIIWVNKEDAPTIELPEEPIE